MLVATSGQRPDMEALLPVTFIPGRRRTSALSSIARPPTPVGSPAAGETVAAPTPLRNVDERPGEPVATEVRLPAALAVRGARTPHEAKVEKAAALVTQASMHTTLTVLCKNAIFGPREAGTAEYILAANWVAQQLRAMGVEPLGDVKDGDRTFLQWFEWKERYADTISKSANVVGILKGSGPEPRKAVILSAHLDNLSKGEKEDYTRRDRRDLSSYEGANDNTASVAILMDTVKALAATGPYVHDVVVLVSSAEEDYLMGAVAFLKDPPIPRAQMIANVNLEMPGHGKTEDIYVYGGVHAAEQERNPLFARAMGVTGNHHVPLKDGLTIDAGARWFDRQDGRIFHEAGVPTILMQGGADEHHYHTKGDTLEELNMAKVELLGRHTCRTVADIADDRAPMETYRDSRRGEINPGGRYVETFETIRRTGATFRHVLFARA
jgi:hypothetical protein